LTSTCNGKMQILSPEIEQPAKPNIERRRQRRAAVERERARGEFELSRAASMVKELGGLTGLDSTERAQPAAAEGRKASLSLTSRHPAAIRLCRATRCTPRRCRSWTE
jgi:hypothetical protein